MKGSWTESIKNRFKHVRKYENKKRASMMQSIDINQPSTQDPTHTTAIPLPDPAQNPHHPNLLHH